MPNFWPEDIDVPTVKSPLAILKEAKNECNVESHGALDLFFQTGVSEKGFEVTTIIACHVPTQRTAALFSIASLAGSAYPVKVQPRDNEVPDFLKKSYYVGLPKLVSERTVVTNPWVADTPQEFREKLAEVFELSSTKTQILNLLSLDQGDVNLGRE